MEISEYKNIYENESNHFIYLTRHQLIITLFKKYVRKHRPNILDAGCGTGLLAKKMEKFGIVWGVDLSPEAIRFAKLRGVKTKRASITHLPFKKNAFDVVTCVDVIYHKAIKDDSKALKEFFRVLKPGGLLIIRVPANKWLELIHDQHVHTRQRYNRSELKNKLLQTGFDIKKISFIDTLLLPLAILQSVKEKIILSNKATSSIRPLSKPINILLTKILSFEVSLISKINLPFGIGLVAVCRKPL